MHPDFNILCHADFAATRLHGRSLPLVIRNTRSTCQPTLGNLCDPQSLNNCIDIDEHLSFLRDGASAKWSSAIFGKS
jgi:hypothetical protein